MTEHIATDDIDRIDENVGDRYPYPLVATYDRALFQAPDPSEAHEYLLDLVEMTLKYLAVIVIAQYFRDGVPDATINHDLKNLQRPSLGHWQGWLRDVLRFYEHDDRVPVARVREVYAKRHTGAIPVAVQGLSRVSAAMGSGAPVSTSETATTQQFFDVLIAYRNRLAHGATPSAYDRANITDILAPAMRQLYAEMSFLVAYRLAYVRGVAVDFGTGSGASGQHRYRHQVTYLVGASPRASSTPRIGDEPVPDKQLYLLDQSEGFVPLLSLHPFLVFAHCTSCNREQVFVLNATTATAQDYLAYQCTHHLRPTAYLDYMQRLLKQLDGDASAWDDEQRTTRWELLRKVEAQEAAAAGGLPSAASAPSASEAAPPATTAPTASAAPVPTATSPPTTTTTQPAAATASVTAPPPASAAPPPPPEPTPAKPLPVLRVKGAGRDLIISADRQVVIGRDTSSDIPYDDIRVSRKHATIHAEGGVWVLDDLNSRNGTFVNGSKVTRVELGGHTQFRLGGANDGSTLETAIQDASAPAPSAPAPAPSAPAPTAPVPSAPPAQSAPAAPRAPRLPPHSRPSRKPPRRPPTRPSGPSAGQPTMTSSSPIPPSRGTTPSCAGIRPPATSCATSRATTARSSTGSTSPSRTCRERTSSASAPVAFASCTARSRSLRTRTSGSRSTM